MNKKILILPAMFLAVLVSVAAGVLAATTTTITPGAAIAGETDLFCHIYVDGQEVSLNDIYPYTIAWKSDAIGATWNYLGVQELDASALSKYMNHELTCAVGYTYTQGGYVIFIQIFPDSNSVPVEPDYTPSANLIVPSQAYLNENVQLQCSASGGNNPLTIEIDAEGNGNFQDVTGTGILNHVYTETGNYNPVCRVTDFDSDVATDDANIRIIEGETGNHAPVAYNSNYQTDENNQVQVTMNAYDPDGDALQYIIIRQPYYGTLSGSGATRTYMPNINWDGTDSFRFRVYDGDLYSNEATVTITVRDTDEPPENLPPVITSTPITEVNEEQDYSYQVTAYDPEEGFLEYSLINSPGWISIDSQTGLIEGEAPGVDEDTGFDITIRVSDTGGAFAMQFYILTVRDTAGPGPEELEIISTPVTEVNETDFYEYQVEAEGGAEPYEFSLTEAPLWLSIDSQTGLVSGTAPEVYEDTDFDVIVEVTDNEGNGAWQSYTLTVIDISGQGDEEERKSAKGGGIGAREIPEDEFYKSLYLSQFEKVFGISIDGGQPEEEPKIIERLLIWLIFSILLILAVITTIHLMRKIKQ